MRGPLDPIAEQYVRLVLALGRHDGDTVDAYYGPPAWREEAGGTLEEIEAAARGAAREVEALPVPADELGRLRHAYLRAQLRAVAARARFVGGARMSFDEESKALYDSVAPPRDEAGFEAALGALDRLLPGSGEIPVRYVRFRADHLVAPGRLSAVFDAAIAECRTRTLARMALPAGETFTVEYVKDRPWNAYNWYQGGARSVIQVNTDLPIDLDRAIDLAAHEGYPGHHVYNALLEADLARGRGFVELMVYALFSPQSLIAEGTANFGIEVAFPGEERLRFERDVLYPAAGLPPDSAARFREVQDVVHTLDHARTESCRRYVDGHLDAAGAAAFLVRYALQTPEKAAQQVRFFDRYRSYIINYNHGLDLVRAWVDAQGGTADAPDRRWAVFQRLLSSPRLPSTLT